MRWCVEGGDSDCGGGGGGEGGGGAGGGGGEGDAVVYVTHFFHGVPVVATGQGYQKMP